MARSVFSTLSPGLAASDEQAMWRVKLEDDPQAFAELVRRWEKPIQRLCARMVSDEHRGQDVAQEAFARLFARRKDYEPSGKFSTFLWRIALNLCYDELRRIKRRREFSLDEPGDDDRPALEFISPQPEPGDAAAAHDRAAHVRQALDQLSEPYRVVVVLRHYEGLKFREIGELLGIPEGTVKSRMSEALTQLGRLLNPVLNDDANETRPRRHECLVL